MNARPAISPVPQQVVTLRNSAGHALHCMWHEPPAGVAMRDTACLLLSPGVKMRVAPHRLYRKLVDVFLARGIPVLRVDFHGLGDSGGELPEVQLDQLYRQVQLGRHVDDALCAIDHVTRTHRIRKVLIGGLCGGALTGLLAAERDQRVVGLYALGIPVNLDGSGEHAATNMTQGQLGSLRRRYIAKLLNPKAWARLLSFRSDYRMIFSSITARLARRRRARTQREVVADVPPPLTPPAANLNPGFPRAFFRTLGSGVRALLVFSGADRLHWEYKEKFEEPWAPSLARLQSLITVGVVPKANHILSDPAWIAETRQMTATWLDANFPG
jgi:uncharacterized protein